MSREKGSEAQGFFPRAVHVPAQDGLGHGALQAGGEAGEAAPAAGEEPPVRAGLSAETRNPGFGYEMGEI